jgi:hypothetical protein
MKGQPVLAGARRVCLVLLIEASIGGLADTSVEIRQPMPLMASDVIARGWLTFDGLPPATGPTKLTFESEPPTGPARVDVLVRRSGRWRVISSAHLTANRTAAVPDNERVAVLVRFERAPNIYAWRDTERVGGEISLTLMRYLRIDPAPDHSADAVLFADEIVPLSRDAELLYDVPLTGGLFCVGDACVVASSSTTAITLPPSDSARVLRAGSDAYDIQVLAPGRLPLRPTTVQATIVRAGSWSSVTIPAEVRWDDVVIDVVLDGSKQRLHGSSLLRLPSWTNVPLITEKGVVVRPLIGPEKTPHGDGDAKLYVFPAETGADLMIPLVTAKLEDGVFKLPQIGVGRYLLKLFSPEAAGEPVTANLTPSVPTDVVFGRGPIIRGRVVRRTAGSPDDPVVIEVIRQTPVADTSAVSDWMRTATADANGSFRIVLTAPGPYRLRARWGAAQGEVDFEVKDMKKDVDLGEIDLDAGAVLHGTLPGCAGGELTMTPLPDLTSALTVPFFDHRRAPVGKDHTFVVEGLSKGEWLIGARCGGAAIDVAPSMVVISDSGVVFLDLQRVEPR